MQPTCQPSSQPTNPTGQPTTLPSTQPSSNPTIFSRQFSVTVHVTTDVLGGTLDGAPCGGDMSNYRKPGQTPINTGNNVNCTFRQAINFCYSQPPWFIGGLTACTVKLPPMAKFVLKAPIVFDPAAYSAVPLTIVLDFSGAIVTAPLDANGLTSRFMSTNTTRHRSNSSALSSHALGTSAARRRLVSIAQRPLDPYDVNLKSGFEIVNCTLLGFGDPLRLGGAIRAENLASFRLTNVVLKNNFASRGGGVYCANVAVVSFSNCQFRINSAATSGGGAFVANVTSLIVQTTRFDGNTASVVGAGLVVDHLLYLSIVDSAFSNNKATGFAGGVSLNDVYGKNYSRIANSTFTANQAYYGSMVALGRVRRISFDGNVFSRNTAVRGCGVFWLRATGMESPRNLLNNRSNIFQLNAAPYGPNYGTEGLTMIAAPRVVSVVDYTLRNRIEATSKVLDYYKQLINDDTSTAYVALKENSPINCRFNNLKAGVFGTVDAQLTGGVATFQYKPVCVPGGSFNATYTVLLSKLPELFPYYSRIERNGGSRKMSTDVTISFRNCRVGEKYDFFTVDKDTCSVCVNSYSLYDNQDLKILSCSPCPKGSETCYSNQIILYPGTWRWNHFSTTIFKCPFTSFGCSGGNSSGQGVCNKGYYGPICGICEWGYFNSPDGTRCISCSGESIISLGLIVIISVLGGIAIYLVYSLASFAKKRKMSIIDAFFFIIKGGDQEDENKILTRAERKTKKSRRSWISRAKIFLATYQVVIATPSTFNINFGPVFTSFIQILKIVNFDFVSFVPVQCFQQFQFVQSMITSSALPLMAIVSFVVMCTVQVWIELGSEQDRMRRRVRVGGILQRYLMVGVAIMSFMLTSVTAKLFKIFDCFDVDPNHEAGDGKLHRFLTVDTAVDCGSEEYRLGLNWAYLMILCYPVAVPVTFFTLLYYNRQEIYGRGLRARAMAIADEMDLNTNEAEQSEAKRQARLLREKFEKMNLAGGGVVDGLTFLYEQFHPEFFLWELVETGRKLSLTSILSILRPGTPMQCTFSVLLAITYVKLYNSCAPFVEDNDNLTAEIGQYQIFVTFFAVLVLKQNSLGDADENPLLYSFVDVCLVGVNLVMICMLVGILWKEYKAEKAAEELRRKQEEEEERRKKRKMVVKEDHESTAREVQDILSALRRHPDVLTRLADKLKATTSQGARRKNVILDKKHLTDELQLRTFYRNNYSAQRRNAVQLSAEELVAGRLQRQGRRRGILSLSGQTLGELQQYLQSDPYLDIRHALQEPSTSSGGSHADDSVLSDDSTVAGTDAPKHISYADELQLQMPTFDADSASSLDSYESPSTQSGGSEHGPSDEGEDDESDLDVQTYLQQVKRRMHDGESDDSSFGADAEYRPPSPSHAMGSDSDTGGSAAGSQANGGARNKEEGGEADVLEFGRTFRPQTPDEDALAADYVDVPPSGTSESSHLRPDSTGSVLSRAGIEPEFDDDTWEVQEAESLQRDVDSVSPPPSALMEEVHLSRRLQADEPVEAPDLDYRAPKSSIVEALYDDDDDDW